MADNRSLIEKLRAMADQDASPREAEVARRVLARLGGAPDRKETPRGLSRESILAQPDRDSPREIVHVRVGGEWVALDRDEYNVISGLYGYISGRFGTDW